MNLIDGKSNEKYEKERKLLMEEQWQQNSKKNR